VSRVLLRSVHDRDANDFLDLVRKSKRLHRPWTYPPATEKRFREYVQRTRRDDFEGLLVCRKADGIILGCCNLSQIFYGPFRNAYLGYWIGASYQGHGYMTEAMPLVMRFAFSHLRLHRLEANIQPGNRRSIDLVRRSGFRREGFSSRYLKIAGRWRDHERWAITVEDWRMLKATHRSGEKRSRLPH
jgi:ribosomal-protein-alanine N-acetyltransferase